MIPVTPGIPRFRPRTLLVTLIARAHDFRTPRPILGDPYAQHILDRLDFDVTKMTMTPNQMASIAVRTSNFDRWTSDFLQHNPDTTVLHLACGLDSRMDRVKWGDNTRKVQPTSLPGRDYSLLGIDVLDEDWIHDISTDGPVLAVMEGLLCYLPEVDVKRLLQQICQTFRRGELLFECINSMTLQALNGTKPIQSISGTGAEFHSCVDDPKTLELLHPGLKLVESIRLAEAPGVEMFPLGFRALMYLRSWIPSVRDAARFLRFQFGEIGEVANE
ncbi:S-adenosyl-L-methionine-dependent methyltransferase [Aspergillus minisclerotigenes]|uniref:S-adenosyl-L-methionine-dependent methyltransferase n=1 Tax=Aspergillus minisclerotigenes TaxID=656917 RepID=A0A5N6J9T0_9EURO|nr:S-adenosyl-L-methionine-dependent methyltransferase [Aspergillus minisclerotigenes]